MTGDARAGRSTRWVRLLCVLRGHEDYRTVYAAGGSDAMCSRCGRWEVRRDTNG